MKTLLAYHGQQAVKDKYVARVKAHGIADEIVRGRYWERGKGCAVGCTIHGNDHQRYETELGIPRRLAHLEDRIFEGMANGSSKEFPLRFLSAIEPGADLSLVWHHFAHWLLVDPEDGVLQYARKKATKDAIKLVAILYARAARGEVVTSDEWSSARRTDAAYAAYAVAAYAVAAAATAYAGGGGCAAYAGATAASAAYASATYVAAQRQAHERQADKLIELLASAPIAVEAIAK